MGTRSQVHAADFPPQLDHTEMETRCVRESFTWGPQAMWLLCGLIWFFYLLVRDIPELGRNTALIGMGATVLAALGVWYDMRRRKRQMVLYPLGGRIGCYRGNVFQYSFTPAEMVRVRQGFFERSMIVLKGLVPMLILIAIVGVVMLDGLRDPGPRRWQDVAIFIYAILFAIFGFVAIFRSNITLAFFWIPNGQGKADKPVHFRPSELRKLEARDGMAIG